MAKSCDRCRVRALVFFVLAATWWLVATAGASTAEPVRAKNGMVAGPERHAVTAGVEILKQGGNAFDAAATVGFALTVTEISAANLGGGGFMTALQADGMPLFLDFRDVVPAAATQDMFLGLLGIRYPWQERSVLAATVPGTVHGLLQVHADYGRLPRQIVLAPAIRLAEEGFQVSEGLSRKLAEEQKRLKKFPTTAATFYSNGAAPRPGWLLKQPGLAATLRRVAEQGVDGFYQGWTADLFVAYMKANGGIITHEDLAGYKSIYRKPVIFAYKDYTVISTPAPSTGGFTLSQTLRLLEPFTLASPGHNSPRYVHTVVEAVRLAFADRNHYLDDPDFTDVPYDRHPAPGKRRARRPQRQPRRRHRNRLLNDARAAPPEQPESQPDLIPVTGQSAAP